MVNSLGGDSGSQRDGAVHLEQTSQITKGDGRLRDVPFRPSPLFTLGVFLELTTTLIHLFIVFSSLILEARSGRPSVLNIIFSSLITLLITLKSLQGLSLTNINLSFHNTYQPVHTHLIPFRESKCNIQRHSVASWWASSP